MPKALLYTDLERQLEFNRPPGFNPYLSCPLFFAVAAVQPS
jgi:hypothetical protein